MSDFPAEVCRVIFDNIERKDIEECRFVCKSWHAHASQVCWKEVSIYSKRITDLKEILKSNKCRQYFKYGHWTQTLVFEPTPLEDVCNKFIDENQPEEYGDEVKKKPVPVQVDESSLRNFTLHEVMQLLTYFPNVQEIKVNNPYFTDYLRLLLNSKLERIKKISTIINPSFFDDDYDKAYFEFCSIHSDTLTSLKYKYTEQSPFTIRNRPIDLYGLLSPFMNVTELIFCDDLESEVTFIQVQEIFPHLTLFSYENVDPISGPIFQRQVIRLGDSIIEFNQKLKKLYLYIDDLPISYSNYILKYLPNHLEHFYLNLDNTNLFEWIEKVGDVYSVQFMERFRRINTFDIFFRDKAMEEEVPRGDDSGITTYFKLVHGLMGERESYCTLIANSPNSMSYRFTYDADKNLILTYGFNSDLDLFLNEDNQVDLHLPDKRISTIGFEIVNRFLLRYNDEEWYSVDSIFTDLSSDAKDDTFRTILERALQNCPNLDHLEVESSDESSKINISPRIDVEVPRSNNSNGQVYLKVVRLQNIFGHSKILQSLVTYLPNIEVISCNYYFSRDGVDEYDKFDNYDTDLTGFTSLEYFYFYVGVRDGLGIGCVIYYFKFTDGDEKKYCYDTEEKKMKSFESIRFDANKVDVITIRVDKSVQIMLHTITEIALGIVENGQLLNLDYPVAMEPYQKNPL